MSANTNIAELLRLIRNIIRTGVVTEVEVGRGCRVKTGDLETDWLPWITQRAGASRSQWPPSVGEQVVILSVGGELTTAVVLPGLFSDEHNEPTASLTANNVTYPDGAVIEYEPATGALKATGIKTALIDADDSITATSPVVIVNASENIRFITPTVICSDNLTCATLNVMKGGEMSGSFNHTGGTFSSNGVVIDGHNHGGVERGGSRTDGPQ
ncbi:phage baseplate assembly protein V [Morganella morganii]|uniref:phage baseplate assembly protein V n=1 Tax=Morganella morganii TaxID=582 RepID=UPI001BDA1B2D|nr:phage baseplate assembly protein V [Morganella morganii]MBT0360473.1 phage baseplate assembly protein V [Morganella morganii subsp. morganii]